MADGITFKLIYLKENMGHGHARRTALSACACSLVALMDADDVSVPERFRLQLEQFRRDPSVSVSGGQIAEFVDDPSRITGVREVPLTDAEIKRYMKKRCPMNQVSVMMVRQDVDEAGGYLDWYCEEDYYLWARLALAGKRFANVPEVLVNVRVGSGMSARRGGMRYFKSEARLQRYLWKHRMIGFFHYFGNVAVRFFGEVLMPNAVRGKLFRFLRGQWEPEKYARPDTPCCADESLPPFSVAMCVYQGDRADWFAEALDSVTASQIQKPDELVLVVDGPIGDSLQKVIDAFRGRCARTITQHPGGAEQTGSSAP